MGLALALVLGLALAACQSGRPVVAPRPSPSHPAVSPATPPAPPPAPTASPTETASPAPVASPSATAASPPPPSVIPPSPTPPAPVSRLVVVGPAGAQFSTVGPGSGAIGHVLPGVVLTADSLQGGWAHVLTPCEQPGWVRLADATAMTHATVVLDPGHGGSEIGAVGPTGLTEEEVNLDVVNRTADLLRARGFPVVLTRTGNYTATLAFRIDVAAAAQSTVFLSIHHNAAPDGPSPGPGTETFYQYTSPASKRLAGLVYEEVTRALSSYAVSWMGNTDRGARWRLNDRGGDYYGLLRYGDQHQLTAALAEMMFISNPAEEALLRRPDVRQVEAEATSRAIIRFLTSNDPGSGFSTPHTRTEPAGGGGGTQGCVDPIGP